MCNACGNLCCGSDEFGGCGCDGCDEPDCWSEEPEDEGDDDFYPADWDYIDCCASPRDRRFVCEAVA